MVSKQTSKNEAGHGRTEERRRKCENPDDTKKFLGKRQRHEYSPEEIDECS